jgi:hypothetical protein
MPGPIPKSLITWGYDNNYTGWVSLLGEEIGCDKVSTVAAPAPLDQVERGRAIWRRSIASWWRSTSISASFSTSFIAWGRTNPIAR